MSSPQLVTWTVSTTGSFIKYKSTQINLPTILIHCDDLSKTLKKFLQKIFCFKSVKIFGFWTNIFHYFPSFYPLDWNQWWFCKLHYRPFNPRFPFKVSFSDKTELMNMERRNRQKSSRSEGNNKTKTERSCNMTATCGIFRKHRVSHEHWAALKLFTQTLDF